MLKYCTALHESIAWPLSDTKDTTRTTLPGDWPCGRRSLASSGTEASRRSTTSTVSWRSPTHWVEEMGMAETGMAETGTASSRAGLGPGPWLGPGPGPYRKGRHTLIG